MTLCCGAPPDGVVAVTSNQLAKPLPLPDHPESIVHQSGTSWEFKVYVAPTDGYTIHLAVEATWHGVTPADVFGLFTMEDNSTIFRDVSAVPTHKILKESEGYREVQREELSEAVILGMTKTSRTWMLITEDSRDPLHLVTTYTLDTSKEVGVVSRFDERWDLTAICDPDTGAVTGCSGRLWQKAEPSGLIGTLARNVPGVAAAIRRAALRVAVRVEEDMVAALYGAQRKE